MADWQIELRDLVVLWVIRVEIVLSVKLTVLIDMAVCRKTCLDGKLYHFFVEDRKRARHTGADRAGMGISVLLRILWSIRRRFLFLLQAPHALQGL